VQNISITLITVTYNAGATIARCIESVIAQNFKNLEYIVIDGGSTDNTLQIINQYKDHIDILISEPDKGMYDAINKGIQRAGSDIIGTLNADDIFADNDVLSTISAIFAAPGVDILYGNLDYVDVNETIVRKWRTKSYTKGFYNFGWMPAHPTFYCRRSLFNSLGFYSLEYGTAADYELMLRFMHNTNLNAFFLNRVIVKMQIGGVSNKSPVNRLKAWGFDLKAMRNNGIKIPLLTLIIKPLRKLRQFF
jgi:glycosyltransferase involved in cell wall biosynthesis